MNSSTHREPRKNRRGSSQDKMNKARSRSKYCSLERSLDQSIRERCASTVSFPSSNNFENAERRLISPIDQPPTALRRHLCDQSADHSPQGRHMPASRAELCSCPCLCCARSDAPAHMSTCARASNHLSLYQPDRSSRSLWGSSQRDRTDCRVVRPLLSSPRSVVTAICRYGKLPIYPDQSNQSVRYARNRIRKQLLPGIQLFLNPQAEDALFQFAQLVSQEQDLVSGFVCTTSKGICSTGTVHHSS